MYNDNKSFVCTNFV